MGFHSCKYTHWIRTLFSISRRIPLKHAQNPRGFQVPRPTVIRAGPGRRPAFTSDETRHHFAIEALDKSGPFRRQPYLYMCVRCKWMFRINDTRGSVIALDGLGRELQEPENAKRVVTFHRGPCPAFPVVEYSVVETQRESAFAGYLSRFVKAVQSLTQLGRHRGHGRREQTIS